MTQATIAAAFIATNVSGNRGTPGYKPEYEKKFGANLIW